MPIDNQEKLTRTSDISNIIQGLHDDIYNDNVKIDGLLIGLCQRIAISGVVLQIELLALKNDALFCLYSSDSSVEEADRTVSPIVTQNLAASASFISCLADSEIEMFCSVNYQDRPLFVLRSRLTNNDEYIAILRSIGDQINLAFSFKEEKRFDRVQKTLIEEFFERDLQTKEAWNLIAKYSAQFLPDFAPFCIQSHPPLVQVLTYKDGDLHLIMRASQSGGNSSAEFDQRLALPLKVDETVCGVLIEKKLDYLLTNPAHFYPERYQAYLFYKQLAKSELVVPIRYGDKIIAILNMEHTDEDVFSEYCVEAIKRAAKSLAPLVRAVITKEEDQRSKEISLLYVMSEVLSRTANIYRHKISQSILGSRTIIERLVKNKKYANDEVIKDGLGHLSGFINQFSERSAGFLAELPNYIKYQRISIRHAIEEAIAELDAVALENSGEIKIVPCHLSNDVYVYASAMLKEHIYNHTALSNAFVFVSIPQQGQRARC